jgi:serine/threonine protein kinase
MLPNVSGTIENTLQRSVSLMLYMVTPREEDPPIGAEHRSKAILGKGSFGEVHLAVNNRSGDQFAVNNLDGRESQMNEVNIMSKLSHVSFSEYLATA